MFSVALALLAFATQAAPPVSSGQPAIPPAVTAWESNGPDSAETLDVARGAFPGASAAQADDWHAVGEYAKACVPKAAADMRSRLAKLGHPEAMLFITAYADRSCAAALSIQSLAEPYHSWQEFEAAAHEAWPLYAGYMLAVRQAERVANEGLSAETAGIEGNPEDRPLRDRLDTRIVGEQTLRLGLKAWDGGKDAPSISAGARQLLAALLQDAIDRRDRANAEWLRAVVAQVGWPTISTVGPSASDAAWLIVQHADDDPAFQAQMLKLMEPLAAQGEVSKRDYALLYDRVMFPITGHQRYGTQYACQNGQFEPIPLEDPAHIEQLRASMGLESSEAGLERVRKDSAVCR